MHHVPSPSLTSNFTIWQFMDVKCEGQQMNFYPKNSLVGAHIPNPTTPQV